MPCVVRSLRRRSTTIVILTVRVAVVVITETAAPAAAASVAVAGGVAVAVLVTSLTCNAIIVANLAICKIIALKEMTLLRIDAHAI